MGESSSLFISPRLRDRLATIILTGLLARLSFSSVELGGEKG